ncbi:MAG: phosphopantothenoylcysteine decarboxylase/phosphopantothenate--cysteine ligase [Lysobacterales bacterium]|jgi:phosphopantothenoylcysteine decarboxylase/phosphopantothenate--cysteine ligase
MSVNNLKNKRILITCGPTWVPIDDMRVISNKSTGTLGHILAGALDKKNAQVTLLEGPVTRVLKTKNVIVKKFHFYDDFITLFKKELKHKYDIVIHAAAVSDYKLKTEHTKKISSKVDKLTLNLVPTEKVIYKIKEINPNALLVGFKLESEMNKTVALERTQNLFEKAKCDFVIANSSTDKTYKAYLIDNNKNFIALEKTRQDIITKLIESLNTHVQ